MKKNVGIDIGTCNTRIYVKGRGIMLDEPSYVAVDSHTYKVLAAGKEAKDQTGRTPGDRTTFRPLKNGVIADYDAAVSMLRAFLEKTSLIGCRAVVAIPSGVSEVERRAVEDALLEAGASSIAPVDMTLAAATGAGLPFLEARGSMVVHMGGGITEAAVIALGTVLVSETLREGGGEVDNAVFSFIKYNLNVLIGEQAAEEMKKTGVSVYGKLDKKDAELRGRNLISGLPAVSTVSCSDLREAVSEQTSHFLSLVRRVLEKTPPEPSGDIYRGGITLTGGGALLGGFASLLNEATGVRVNVAPRPSDCVINGLGELIDREDLLSFRAKTRASFL